jgi:Domain of unknown function (DUF4831)
MKTKIRIFVVLFIVLASCTNIIVRHVSAVKEINPKNHLLTYYLPKRQIEIKFTLEHQVIDPSPFLEESTVLNPIIESVTGKKMIKKRLQKLVLKEIEINPISVPDPAKLYSVDYRRSPFSKLDGNISISENGLIQTGTSSTESKAYQIIQTGVETIAGIVSNIVGLKKGPSPKDTTISSKDTETVKKAKDLLKKLEDVQSIKSSLIASTMNMDSKLFEAKLSIINELEDGLIQQLTGEISKEEYVVYKSWVPKTEDIVGGEIKITYDIGMTLGENSKVKLNIPVIMIATVDKNISNEISAPNTKEYDEFVNTQNKKIGFYYNIPIPIEIKVYKDKVSDFTQLNFTVNSNKQSSIILQMPQLGTVDFLPARLTKSEVKFYSDLGSIKEYSFTKDVAINPAEAKNISSSIDTVFSTIKYLKNLNKPAAIDEKTTESDESKLYNVNITITPENK